MRSFVSKVVLLSSLMAVVGCSKGPKPEQLVGSWRGLCDATAIRGSGPSATVDTEKRPIEVTVKKESADFSFEAKIGTDTVCSGSATGEVSPKREGAETSKDGASVKVDRATCNPMLGSVSPGFGAVWIYTDGEKTTFGGDASVGQRQTSMEVRVPQLSCELTKAN